MTAQIAAAVALPAVAALHRFSVRYGYAGVPRSEALRDAAMTAAGTAGLSVLLLAASGVSSLLAG